MTWKHVVACTPCIPRTPQADREYIRAKAAALRRHAAEVGDALKERMRESQVRFKGSRQQHVMSRKRA